MRLFIEISLVSFLCLLASFAHASKIDIDAEINSCLTERDITGDYEVEVLDNSIRGAYIIKIWSDNNLYVKAIQYKKQGNNRVRDSGRDDEYREEDSSDDWELSPCRKILDRINIMPGHDTVEQLSQELIVNCTGQKVGDSLLGVSYLEGGAFRIYQQIETREHWPIVKDLLRRVVEESPDVNLMMEFKVLLGFVEKFPDLLPEYMELREQYAENLTKD